MEKETILENAKMGLWYHSKEKIIHHQIKKFIYGDDFKELLTKGADAFIKYSCHKWLSDDQSNTAVRQEDLDWGDENWSPRVVNAGWKYWALVLPKTVLGKMPMTPLIEQYKKSGVTVQTFDNTDDAFTWLNSL